MKSKLAIWSFVSAILIIVLGFVLGTVLFEAGVIWIFFIFYLIPLLLGIFALREIKKSKKLEGRGFAITGIVLAILLYVVNLVPLVFDLGTGSPAY